MDAVNMFLDAMESGNAAEAVTIGNSILASDPTNRQVLHNLAVLKLSMGATAEAEKLWTTAIDAHSQDPAILLSLLGRSQVFSAKGQLEHALNDLIRAHNLEPSNALVAHQLASMYNRAGQPDRAVQLQSTALNNATANDNENLAVCGVYPPLLFYHRALYVQRTIQSNRLPSEVLPQLTAVDAASVGLSDLNQCITLINSPIAGSTASPVHIPTWKILLCRGTLLRLQERYAESLNDIQAALESLTDVDCAKEIIHPRAILTHERAIIYYHVEQFDSSIQLDTDSLQLLPPKSLTKPDLLAFPLRYECHYDRSLAAFQLGNTALAIEDLTECIKAVFTVSDTEPLRSIAARSPVPVLPMFVNRGFAYAQRYEYQLAIDDWTRALEIDPRNVQVLNARAAAHYALGHIDEALADWNASIAIQPTAQALQARGQHYLQNGEYAKAIADFTDIIELFPDDNHLVIPALLARAMAKMESGDLKSAQEDCMKVLKLEPNNAKAHFVQSQVYEKMGDLENAYIHAHAACEADPMNVVFEVSLHVFSCTCVQFPFFRWLMMRNVQDMRARLEPLVPSALVERLNASSTRIRPIQAHVAPPSTHSSSSESLQMSTVGHASGDPSLFSVVSDNAASAPQTSTGELIKAPVDISIIPKNSSLYNLAHLDPEFVVAAYKAGLTDVDILDLLKEDIMPTPEELEHLRRMCPELFVNGKLIKLSAAAKVQLALYRKRLRQFPVLKRWAPGVAAVLQMDAMTPQKPSMNFGITNRVKLTAK